MDASHAWLQSEMEQTLVNHGVDPSQFVYLRDFSKIGMSIRQAGTVCLLQSSVGTFGRKDLVSVPITDEDMTRTMYLYRKKRGTASAADTFFNMVSTIS